VPLAFRVQDAQTPEIGKRVKVWGQIVVERSRSITESWAALAARPRAASLALLMLCCAVYLPGFVRLPAVDRTEIIYAETTRDMVARGDWTDPRYSDVVHQYRPIGTFWAQSASAWLAGDALARDIRVYRVPSLIAVTLSVLALFWLGSLLVGAEAALIAAALFAVAPLTVLVSQLAIAEGLSLLPATVAMLALLCLYRNDRQEGGEESPAASSSLPLQGVRQLQVAASAATARLRDHAFSLPTDRERAIALLFWAALGLGMLINALLVPILVLATLIALYVMDRDLSWLKRLRPLTGVPIALLIAAPWLIVRAHQDGGVPFSGMSLREFLGALGGAQDMKLRAMPGTFVLALVLGFLPGTALLGSAFARFWDARHQKLARFLLAWVIGYLVYLEALSSKPGTYMVQTMFPALALAVASVVVAANGSGRPPKWHGFPWPIVLAVLPLAIFAGVFLFARQWPSGFEAFLIGVITVLFVLSGRQGREGGLRRWAATGVAALGLLAITLLGFVLPSIGEIWPAERLERAIAACPETEVGLVGFREPSSRFVLGVPQSQQTVDAVVAGIDGKLPRLAIVENRWVSRIESAARAQGKPSLPPPSACVSAYNVMRGCPLHFRIYETRAAEPCAFPADLACSGNPEPTASRKAGGCD
jgi:4-amino-4-deoxy-L-arabinose transferase-like glycosyltransferase